MTGAESLLPAGDAAPRCSAFAREIGLRPTGTAIRADQVLVADLPLPWPAPVKTHPLLHGLMDVAGSSPLPTRLLAGVATHDEDGLRVRRFRRAGGTASRVDYRVPMSRFGELIGMIATDDPALDELEVAAGPVDAVLVCTQGSHDVCCGTDGLRLFDAVRSRFLGVEVIRVSHMGGHRFAPTAFTFPDGRMWAGLDEQLLAGILDRSGDPARLAARCRGWWGVEQGPAQVAEVAAFETVGWSLDRVDRRAEVIDDRGDVVTVAVHASDLRFLVDVEATREVPTIACRAAGGLPYKADTEYRALAVKPG